MEIVAERRSEEVSIEIDGITIVNSIIAISTIIGAINILILDWLITIDLTTDVILTIITIIIADLNVITDVVIIIANWTIIK